MIYLDNSATTMPSKICINTIKDIFLNKWANPASLYEFGMLAEKEVEISKGLFSKTLNVKPENIFFTSGGTEANNIAIFGACQKSRKKKLITTCIEHKSVLSSFYTLEKQGFEVIYIEPTKSGDIDIEEVCKNVDADTTLVSCMHVNNETGAIVDVFKLSEMIKKKNSSTLFHCDAVQSYCKVDLNLKDSFIDFMSFSGHKIFAPKGIGALYVKNKTKLLNVFDTTNPNAPLKWGTENVAFIKVFAECADLYYNMLKENFSHVNNLKTRLIENLKGVDGVSLNLPKNHMPYILSLWIHSIKSETLLHFLEREGVLVSSGSACNKGNKSYVLSFFDEGKKRADESIRVSFCCNNNLNDVDIFTSKLKKAMNELIKVR